VPTNASEEVLALGRCGCPHRFEVGSRPTAKLYIRVDPAAGWIGVEVEERLAPQMEVRAVSGPTRHVHEPIGRAERLDELRVCHPALAVDLIGLVSGQRRTRPRSAVCVSLLITTGHPPSSRSTSRLVPANKPFTGALGTSHSSMCAGMCVMRSRWSGVVLATALLSVAACAHASTGRGGQSDATSSIPRNPVPRGLLPPDPCALVSEAQVSTAFGQAMTSETARGPLPDGMRFCFWASRSGVGRATLSVVTDPALRWGDPSGTTAALFHFAPGHAVPGLEGRAKSAVNDGALRSAYLTVLDHGTLLTLSFYDPPYPPSDALSHQLSLLRQAAVHLPAPTTTVL
jgi:hypothetical protein